MKDGIKLEVARMHFFRGTGADIFITSHGITGDQYLFNNVRVGPGYVCTKAEFTFVPVADQFAQISPAFTLQERDCQQLIDGLWNEGFRPSNGTGNVGELTATQRHLDDMRGIVKHALGMQKV